MGCGPLQGDRRRMLVAYHGVAAPSVEASMSTANPLLRRNGYARSVASSSETGRGSGRGDPGNISDFEGSTHLDVEVDNVSLLQRLRVSREQQHPVQRSRRKPARGAARRKDNLLNFGRFHLRIVDELATAHVDVRAPPSLDSGLRRHDEVSGGGCSTSFLTTTTTTAVVSTVGEDHRTATPRSAGFEGVHLAGTELTGYATPSSPSHTPMRAVPTHAFTITRCGCRAPSQARHFSGSGAAVKGFRLQSVGGLRRPAKFLLLSPSGDLLFSCAKNSATVQVDHIGLGCNAGVLEGHTDAVLSGDVSANGQLVATASRDGSAVVWDTATRKMRLSLPHPKVVFCCRFDPQGTHVVTACQDGLCREWSLVSGREIRSFAGHAGLVYAISYSSDGSRILSGGSEHRILVWSSQRRTGESERVPLADTLAYHPFETSSPSKAIADRTHDSGSVAIFSGHVAAVFSLQVRCRSQGRGGDVVVSADERLVLVWDLTTLTRIASFDICVLRDAKLSHGKKEGGDSRNPRRAYWTAASFAPAPFDKYILVGSNRRALRMLRFMPEEATASSSPRPPVRSSVHRFPTTDDSVPALSKAAAVPRISSALTRTSYQRGATERGHGDDDGVTGTFVPPKEAAEPTDTGRYMLRRPPSSKWRCAGTARKGASPHGMTRELLAVCEEDNHVAVQLRAPVCAVGCGGVVVGSGPSLASLAAVGDKFGNTYLFHVW